MRETEDQAANDSDRAVLQIAEEAVQDAEALMRRRSGLHKRVAYLVDGWSGWDTRPEMARTRQETTQWLHACILTPFSRT